jgi:predicted aconitase with swiveling domain
LYLLKKDGHHPKAIIIIDPEETVVAGAVMTDIPMVYHLDQNPLKVIATGDTVKVDADKGLVEITKK